MNAKIYTGDIQPNTKEYKIWIDSKGSIKTYNSHTKQWGNVTSSSVPEEPTSQYEFVDLGLPSGTKWATTNLGATKPEEAGLYFAWGETEGYAGSTDTKKFTEGDYRYGLGMMEWSKYNEIDGLTVLEDSDDAAYTSDGFCRMPSKEDLEELVENTTAKLETLGGVKGCRLTSTKNSNSIFIPYTGQYMDGQLYGMDKFGLLWSNTNAQSAMNANVFALSVIEDGVSVVEFMRYSGIPIRPVKS